MKLSPGFLQAFHELKAANTQLEAELEAVRQALIASQADASGSNNSEALLAKLETQEQAHR